MNRSPGARALLAVVQNHARDAGIRDIRIKTWAFNKAAQDAFLRLGFRPRALEFDLITSADASPASDSLTERI